MRAARDPRQHHKVSAISDRSSDRDRDVERDRSETTLGVWRAATQEKGKRSRGEGRKNRGEGREGQEKGSRTSKSSPN